MIIGIGTDIVILERIARLQEKFGDRFAQRVLTSDEFALYTERYRSTAYLGSRFAAKEACSKALGTGIGKVSFQDMETSHSAMGGIEVKLYGYAAECQKIRDIQKVHLSLSDEKTHAIAFVIMES